MGESGRQVIRLSTTPTGKQLLVLVNSVKIGGTPLKIITFQDIEPEIEKKEMESWQTISRIMAHEIMNSLTPLSSLTETGIMLLENDNQPKDVNHISQKTIDNLHQALKTISDRNRALTEFERLRKEDPVNAWGLKYTFDFAYKGILHSGGIVILAPGHRPVTVIETDNGPLIEQQ